MTLENGSHSAGLQYQCQGLFALYNSRSGTEPPQMCTINKSGKGALKWESRFFDFCSCFFKLECAYSSLSCVSWKELLSLWLAAWPQRPEPAQILLCKYLIPWKEPFNTEGRQKLVVDLGKQKKKDKTSPEQQESGHKVTLLDADAWTTSEVKLICDFLLVRNEYLSMIVRLLL